MNRRNWRRGVIVFMMLLLLCTFRIMIADANEASRGSSQNSSASSMDEAGKETDAADEVVQDTAVVDEVKQNGDASDEIAQSTTATDEVVQSADDTESTGNSSDEQGSVKEEENKKVSAADGKTEEMRAVWLFFEEINKKASSYEKWKSYIDKTFDICKAKKMNTVILQVRPCADAMYPSKYFPWSQYATGTAGKNPGFDPLKYAVTAAHKRGLSIQAWVNPYRITLSSTKISALPANSIARKWATSKKKSEKRNVLKVNGALYFNPASSQVRTLVANGVKELVKNYNVDGIHMDDYFYPSLGTTNLKKFDYSEYTSYVKQCKKEKKTSQSLVSWRRSNVNKMVKKVYTTVKNTRQDCEFGISPAGNLKNLYADTKYYSDVKLWMGSSGYLDYICPQIYWSFTQQTAPYKKMLKEWIAIPKNSKVKLYVGLAGYRAGISLKEAKAVVDTGWAKSNTILKRQVEYARSTKKVSGFCLFSNGSLTRAAAAKEIKNLVKVLD